VIKVKNSRGEEGEREQREDSIKDIVAQKQAEK
jgi:hypothetical protein